jgi:hypothetical protein
VAFWNNMPVVRIVVEQGLLPWAEMPGLYTGLRLLGSPSVPAYAAHLVVALGVAVAVAWTWSRKIPLPIAAAVLVPGTLLVTPYSFNYDLTLLAVPIALLAWDGYRNGWMRGEREVLALAWLLPLVMAPITIVTSLPVGFAGLAAMFAIALRRARAWDRGGIPAPAANQS